MARLKKLLLYTVLPIFLTSVGEFMLKAAINSMSLNGEFSVNRDIIASAPQHVLTTVLYYVFYTLKPILSDPLILLALFCILGGGFVWLVAMSKYELSFLYPFLSLNYLVIVFGSKIFLGEEVSFIRWISVLFIIGGLIIISRSPYAGGETE